MSQPQTTGRDKEAIPVSGYDGAVPNEEEQKAAICAALDRAAEGDAWGMLVCLHQTNILVAIKRSVQKKWPGVPEEEIDHLVGEAVDALFAAAQAGTRIDNPVGFILKVMHRKAYDYAEIRKRIYALDPERDGYEPHEMETYDVDEVDSDDRRGRAVAIARSLLSKLGQHSIQVVMSYVFQAVEEGRVAVSTHEIVEATGLSPSTVRQSLSRGWRRLERIAKEENVASMCLKVEGFEADGQGA